MKEVLLTEVCDIQYGFAFDSNLFSESEGVPLVRIRDVVRGYSETYTKEPFSAEYEVRDGDILIGMDGEFNIAKWNGGKAALNQRVCKLIPKAVDSGFIFYFMLLALKKIEEKTPFVTVKHLSAKELNKISVPLPSMERQRIIAETLDKVNRLISLRKKQLQKLDDLVKSRFVEMFGTLSLPAPGCDVLTIQDVCEPIKDGTHQTPEYTDDKDKGYLFLSSKDVNTGYIDWSHPKYIPEYLHRELYSRIAPHKGDILLAKNGTTGIAAIVDRDEVFDIYVSLAWLRPKGIDPVFLWAAINNEETKKQFDSSLKGIGVPNLHLGEIKKTKILVGSHESQQKFSSFVSTVNKTKLTVQQGLDKLELLKQSLMKKYFR